MPWWLYIAFKQLFPSGKKIALFTFVSSLGVALGVLALFGVQSVMNGFHEKIVKKRIDTAGHIFVYNSRGQMQKPELVAKDISELLKDKVHTTEVVVSGPSLMVFNNKINGSSIPVFPVLRSFDAYSGKSAIKFEENNYIIAGSLDSLDDESIIMGYSFARKIGASIGDDVEVYSPAMLDEIKDNSLPMPKTLKISGIFNTDLNEVDSNVCIVTLRNLRDLYAMRHTKTAHQLSIRLNEDKDTFECANLLKKHFGNKYLVRTWIDNNSAFLQVLQMEKLMMSFVIILIVLVASFSICASLYTSVVRKTKEIGLLRAMGAKRSQIALIFCSQGLFIGICGTLLGFILTFIVLYFRNDLAGLIVGKQNLINFYFFSELPVKYSIKDAIGVGLFAICSCVLAGIIPALYASKFKPAEAMRNE